MDYEFRDKFAIVGLGVTKVGHMPDYSARTLQTEAARLAIEDAGLKAKDIDGAINSLADGSGGTPGMWTDAFPRVLGLPVKFYFNLARGGAVAALSLITATRFLEMGLANYVVVAYGSDDWSRMHKGKDQVLMPMRKKGVWGDCLGELTAASFHSQFASRHMFEYGTTSRQLGMVAVSERKWACLNPAAYLYGRPITIEDHQTSAVLVWPYHLLDYSLVSDGGTAFVITTAERAKGLRKPPVYIMGFGSGEQMRQLWWDKKNYTQLDVAPSKEAAFKMAGIELKDIDVAQFYDCFTAEVLFQLEDYGWCKKGEGGPFVEAGNIMPGGTIPVNTGGGLLCSHHHLDFTPMAEGVIQMRGEGGERQVKDAEICQVSGHGGEIIKPGMCSIHTTTILRR